MNKIIKNLNDYIRLKRELDFLKRQLSNTPMTAQASDLVKASDIEFPYIQGNSKVKGVISNPEWDRLNNAIEKRGKKISEVDKFVNSIDDEIIKESIKLKYMGKRKREWKDVWNIVEYYKNPTALERAIQRFLKKF